jgi:cytochrome c oxidase subunit III
VATSTATGGPIVAHHFNNLRQQQATVRFGMWLFLVTEVLFFGGIFCAYTVYRLWYPREFEAGSTALNPLIAGINSFLLLGSSFTSVLAIRAAYNGDQRGLRLWIAATIVLGTAFLGFKAREYYDDYREGLVPSAKLAPVDRPEVSEQVRMGEPRSEFGHNLRHALQHKHYYERNPGKLAEVDLDRARLFFMFYYSMTGLHVIHMVVGIGLWVWQLILAYTGFFVPRERYVYVEVLALYWHFVELVWIFLLPLLYMAGHHHPEGLRL